MDLGTVWLYSESHEDGMVTGGRHDDAVFSIEDHLVEIPRGRVADELLNQPEYRNEFGGRFVVPAHAYRRATEDEVRAFLARRRSPAPVAVAPARADPDPGDAQAPAPAPAKKSHQKAAARP